MTDKIVVLCACNSTEEAERLGRLLVERRLAACVSIVPAVRSIYRWQGRIEENAESLLTIKTSRARFTELSDALRDAHSYDVPEVIAFSIVAGSQGYLDWLEKESSPSEVHE